jgi:hypothetical protein
MIQRIQTFYFIGAVLLVAVPLFMSHFFEISFGSDILQVTPFYTKNVVTQKITSTNYSWILQMVIIFLLMVTIFSFKNRKRQIQLGWIAFSVHLISTAWIALSTYLMTAQTSNVEESISMEMGVFSFASAFLFIFLGIQGVRKDKALVDSLNRIR